MPDDIELDIDEAQIRPFAAYLTETNRGRTHADLSEQFHELIQTVLDTGKAGTITLTVKVEADSADEARLMVTESVRTKLPQPAPRRSIFFADSAGNLTRKDPNQLSFGDISPVADNPKTAKEARA